MVHRSKNVLYFLESLQKRKQKKNNSLETEMCPEFNDTDTKKHKPREKMHENTAHSLHIQCYTLKKAVFINGNI